MLSQTAEDETGIIGKCEWDRKKDEVWGWCGKKSEEHECSSSFVHVVGNDPEAYQKLAEAFQSNKIATYARVIMINPIHIDLPPFVILLRACCNTFTHRHVLDEWNSIQELYDKYLLPVLGPLVGHASDGDSRRRKLHLLHGQPKNESQYTIENKNFSFSAEKVLNGVKTCQIKTSFTTAKS